MKMNALATALIAAAGLGVSAANAAVVTVGHMIANGPLGYMNVFELPANGGGFVFGSAWGVPDLRASINVIGSTATMSPNTIGDPDPFWYIGGGGPGHAGNKIMDANLYSEQTGVYSGTLTFNGRVISNSLTSAHHATIFIRDFAADYSSFNTVTADANAGDFSISLALVADSSRHVQFGFNVTGVNVWETDVSQFGNVVFGPPVPAPGTLAFLGAGALLVRRRR